jgi:hypothetical protein
MIGQEVSEGKARRKYDEQFKREAVRFLEEAGGRRNGESGAKGGLGALLAAVWPLARSSARAALASRHFRFQPLPRRRHAAVTPLP